MDSNVPPFPIQSTITGFTNSFSFSDYWGIHLVTAIDHLFVDFSVIIFINSLENSIEDKIPDIDIELNKIPENTIYFGLIQSSNTPTYTAAK